MQPSTQWPAAEAFREEIGNKLRIRFCSGMTNGG